MADYDGMDKIKTKWFLFHPHSYGIATLMRIGITFPGGRKLLLHHFRPHQETEFHDHPWSFRTLVLWGSYVDESLHHNRFGEAVIRRDRLSFLSTRKRSELHAHRTSSKHQVWTLVLTSKKKRSWCKGTPTSWVCDGEVEDFDATRGMVKV